MADVSVSCGCPLSTWCTTCDESTTGGGASSLWPVQHEDRLLVLINWSIRWWTNARDYGDCLHLTLRVYEKFVKKTCIVLPNG